MQAHAGTEANCLTGCAGVWEVRAVTITKLQGRARLPAGPGPRAQLLWGQPDSEGPVCCHRQRWFHASSTPSEGKSTFSLLLQTQPLSVTVCCTCVVPTVAASPLHLTCWIRASSVFCWVLLFFNYPHYIPSLMQFQ